MFDADPPPDNDPAGEPNWRAAQLAILRELNELNMRLARAVVARAEAAAALQAEPAGAEPMASRAPDPSLALSRLGRAVRLTLAMEARLREAATGATAKRPRTLDDILADDDVRRGARIQFVRMGVGDALEAALGWPEAHERPDGRDREDLMDDIVDRVNALPDEIFNEVPMGVLIDRLCAEFDLEPNAKTLGDANDHHTWRGRNLPPHEPRPPDDADPDQVLESSS